MAVGKTSGFIQAVQNDQISFWKTAAGNVESRSWEGLSCWVGPVSSCFFHPAFSTHWRGSIGRQQPTRASQRVGTVVGAADVGLIDHQSLAHRFYTKSHGSWWCNMVQHGAFHYLPSNRGSFGWQWRCRLMPPPGISCIAAGFSSFPWRSQW